MRTLSRVPEAIGAKAQDRESRGVDLPVEGLPVSLSDEGGEPGKPAAIVSSLSIAYLACHSAGFSRFASPLDNRAGIRMIRFRYASGSPPYGGEIREGIPQSASSAAQLRGAGSIGGTGGPRKRIVLRGATR